MAKEDIVFVGQLSADCRTITLRSSDPARFLGGFLGEEVQITVKKVRHSKTTAQLGYWWGVIVPTFRAFWKDTEGISINPEDAHIRIMFEAVGAKLVEKQIGKLTTYVIDRPMLSKASIEETSTFIDSAIKYLAEQGIEVDQPGETGTLSDY